MTKEEAIRYMETRGWSQTRLGLGRTRELLERLGNPQRQLKFIHVAGSNGKGSTCAMLDSILREAGYRTGLYISPYIEDFCERIQVNGERIPGEALGRITERVRKEADDMEDHPSHFELITTVGMIWFLETGCDVVVLEVGLGGEMDSTNVIDAPEAAVITNLGIEHTEYLGNTLREIASAKAGIIKRGTECVCYESEPEAVDTVKNRCRELEVPFHLAGRDAVSALSSSLEGQLFSRKGQEYFLPLLGPHQLRNAGVVLETVEVLRARGWRITEENVRRGMAAVRWPARLEVLRRDPPVLLDGGHNPQCAEALAESLRTLLPGEKAVFLCGVLRDKDYPRMIGSILPYAKEFICLSPLSERALKGTELAAWLGERGIRARAAETVEEGLEDALRAAGDGPLVIFGSLYLAGAARTAFRRRMEEKGEKA